MDKLVYTKQDGGVCVGHAAPKEHLEKVLGPLTDEQYEAHVISRSIPVNTQYVRVNEQDLPDREFRNAWKLENNVINHDLEKAREIQLTRIRQAREPKFVELDKEFMLALEKGHDTSVITSAKQELRDITEPLKNAVLVSIEDVKNAFPESLRGV